MITKVYFHDTIESFFMSNKVKVDPPRVLGKVELPIKSNVKRTRKNFILPDDNCYYCNRKLNEKIKATKDHLIPKSKGGTDSFSNLFPCCLECNKLKSDLNLTQFKTVCATVKKILNGEYSLNENDLEQIMQKITTIKNKYKKQ